MLATVRLAGAGAQDGGRPGSEALPSERLRRSWPGSDRLARMWPAGPGPVRCPIVSRGLADGQDGYQQAGHCGSKRGC